MRAPGEAAMENVGAFARKDAGDAAEVREVGVVGDEGAARLRADDEVAAFGDAGATSLDERYGLAMTISLGMLMFCSNLNTLSGSPIWPSSSEPLEQVPSDEPRPRR